MSFYRGKSWYNRVQGVVRTLQEQGVTNLRQLYRWLNTVEVSLRIFQYLRQHPGFQGGIFWAAAFLVGVFAVFYAWLFGLCADYAQSVFRHSPLWFALLAPSGFVASWWLVWRHAPGAAGGGIPEVMISIEASPVQATRWVSLKVASVKFLSSLACVLGGGAIGREGPTIQIAASLFFAIGMPFKKIWPSLSHQSLLIAGGSAGIAAAFNTPLGGIVFAVEELSHQHFNRFKHFLISAVIISGLVAQWLLGPYLYLGYPKLAVISFGALPWALATGVVCGLAGGAFGRALVWLGQRQRKARPKTRAQVALLVGLAMAGLALLLGPEVLGGGSDLVSRLLFEEDRHMGIGEVLGRFVGPLISSLAGGAMGVFAPALAAGASMGALFSQWTSSPYPNLLVLLGMASFLSGMSRAPFTAFVLVLEMTDRHSAIFPLMVASLVASLAAKLIDKKSYYERRCDAYRSELG